MTRRKRRIPLRRPPRDRRPAVLLVAAIVLLAAAYWWSPPVEPPAPESLDEVAYQVQRVVDGDTLVLAGRKVRLIGADTPETVMPNHPVEIWGLEATQFTREFVSGKTVRLEFDGPRRDKHGRILAHVWVEDRILAEELIRAGLATAETRYRYSPLMKARFRRAQAEARAAGRGIWSQ